MYLPIALSLTDDLEWLMIHEREYTYKAVAKRITQGSRLIIDQIGIDLTDLLSS